MTVKGITFVYKLEVPSTPTVQENAITHFFAFLPFAEEKAATRYTTITMEKPEPEDTDTLPEKHDIEKTKITGDFLLE